jgi:hypothetical protein
MLDNRLLPEEKSYDLSKVLEKFMSASINKNEKAKVEDETKMIMHLVKSQPEYVTVEGQIVYEGNKPLGEIHFRIQRSKHCSGEVQLYMRCD